MGRPTARPPSTAGPKDQHHSAPHGRSGPAVQAHHTMSAAPRRRDMSRRACTARPCSSAPRGARGHEHQSVRSRRPGLRDVPGGADGGHSRRAGCHRRRRHPGPRGAGCGRGHRPWTRVGRGGRRSGECRRLRLRTSGRTGTGRSRRRCEPNPDTRATCGPDRAAAGTDDGRHVSGYQTFRGGLLHRISIGPQGRRSIPESTVGNTPTGYRVRRPRRSGRRRRLWARARWGPAAGRRERAEGDRKPWTSSSSRSRWC